MRAALILVVGGRARPLCKDLLSDRFDQFTCGVSFITDPKLLAYSESSVPSGAKSLEAVRVAFPQSAGVVFLAPQLPKSVPEWWIAPEEVDAPHVTSCFHVDMSEWTACVRRMFRANFGLELPPDSCCPSLAAGALPVLRSKVKDRFGGDRCPFNAHEILVHRALRPSAPRMRRLILCIHETLELHFRNASDPQVTAARIPWTWLENPSGSYLDSAADTSMGSWCSADLVSSGSDMQHVESSKNFSGWHHGADYG